MSATLSRDSVEEELLQTGQSKVYSQAVADVDLRSSIDRGAFSVQNVEMELLWHSCSRVFYESMKKKKRMRSERAGLRIRMANGMKTKMKKIKTLLSGKTYRLVCRKRTLNP